MMEPTRSVIASNSVDLSEIEALLRFLALGFSFASSFQVIKSNTLSSIPKSEATRLRTEFSALFGGRAKRYLRKRLPLLLIGLVQFAVQKSNSVELTQRLTDFKDLIRKYDDADFSVTERSAILDMATHLEKPYYSDFLNSTLDPLSSFFDGQTPKSFSNAVTEFVDSLGQPDVVVVLTPADPSTPNLRLLEDDKDPNLTVVLPEFEIIEPKEPEVLEKPKEPEVVTKDSKNTDKSNSTASNLWIISAVCGSIALAGIVYFARKRRDAI